MLELYDKTAYMKFLNEGFDYGKRLLGEHNAKIACLLKGHPIPPLEVEIQPSSICNINCIHCLGRNEDRVRHMMDEQEIEDLIDNIFRYEINGLKIERIKFSGLYGDPTLNPATFHALQLLVDKKNTYRPKSIGLFTNGVALPEKYFPLLLKINYIHFSLDAATSQCYSVIKGAHESNFENVIRTIEKLANAKSVRGSRLDITAGFVTTPGNCFEIYEFARLAKNLGVNIVRYKFDITNPPESIFNKNSKNNVLADLERAKELSDDSFQVFVIHDEKALERLSNFSTAKTCYAGKLFATIGPNGVLYPCFHRTGAGRLNYGSLVESEAPLKRLWENAFTLPDQECRVCSPYCDFTNHFLEYLVNSREAKGSSFDSFWTELMRETQLTFNNEREKNEK
ncbi:MAG: radical SAM protein [Desulfamplus sp.]|nr:radical SAM protein [Desulfamplus sp.]